MTRSTPTIHDRMLLLYEEEQESSIVVGSAQWFAWLHRETSTIFSFHAREGSYTARKERAGNRRGGWYWKAYHTHQGTLYRAYLGRSEDLNLTRLGEIARLLAARIHGRAPTPQDSAEVAPHLQDRTIAAPLLETKLHPPHLSALLIDRSRLLTQLDSSWEHKITLLQAPAGFGKTTLVNQWLSTRSTSSALPMLAWVSLDANDNDLLRFWRYVMTACQTLLGQEQRASGQQTLALITTAIAPPFEQTPIEAALTRLLNDLAEPASGGLLVLDDYHAITEPRIHETLAFFINHLPKTVHVLLLSRAEPPLPLLRWRARGELCEMHRGDLRFSEQEMVAFLHQTLPISLSEDAFIQLDSSLEGWAAGLRLLCLTLSRWQTPQTIEQAFLSLGKHTSLNSLHRTLLDYFVSEILEAQSEPMQCFLLQTSMLGRLCGPLCDAVTASENSAARLEAIERAGLFLEALEGSGGWYRFHTLFAEAIRREASRRLSQEALQAYSLRASYWYEQEALLPEAIETAWLARNVERIASLIEQIDIQRDFYEPQTILRWLEQLPEEVLHTHPLLCLIFAIELRFPVELRFPHEGTPTPEVDQLSEAERSRIETLLQMAEEGWGRLGIRSWIGAIWSFRVLSGLLAQESFSALVECAQQGLVFLPQEGALEWRLRLWRGTCLLFVGIDKLRMGQVGEARKLLLQALEDNVPPGNKYFANETRLMLGKGHLIQGELQQANRYYCQVLSDAREMCDDEIVMDTLLEIAWLAFEWNDLRGAEQHTREALELAQHIHSQKQEFYDRATLQFALLQHTQGETVTALQQLTFLQNTLQREWTPTSLWLCSRIRYWQGRLRLATGDLQAVHDALETQEQNREHISTTEYLEELLLQGRLLLAQGKVQDAQQHLAHLLPIAQEQLHQYAVLEIQLLLALTHAACNQHQQAHYWLRQTLLQAVHEGYVRLFLNEGEPMALLLRSLLPVIQHDIKLRSYVQMLLHVEATKVKSPYARVSIPYGLPFEPLSAQEQRVLRLLAAGWTNQEIAHELIVSVNTVKYHVKHLYQKLRVSNRLQASEVARSLRLGETL